MRRSMVWLILLVTLGLVLVQQPSWSLSSAAVPCQERLLNGGFEDSSSSWFIPSWQSSLIMIQDAQSHSGGHSLRVQGRTANLYMQQDTRPASPGERLEISGWIYFPERKGAMTVYVDLVPKNAGGGDMAFTSVATFSAPNTSWVSFAGSALMPDKTASVKVRVRVPTQDGTFYLDDLSLHVQGCVQSGGTPTSTATKAPTATATATVSASTPTNTAAATGTSTSTATAAAATATSTWTPTVATATPAPSNTPTPEQPTATSPAVPTSTPTATALPAPTATPTATLPPPTAEPIPTIQLKDFVGVNAVVNNSCQDVAQVAGWVRDYHKWYWYEPTDDAFQWTGGWPDLDAFYGCLKAANVKIMPDVEFAPAWASSDGTQEGQPNAAKHAEYMEALVRHYADTISAVENYNEPDQTNSPFKGVSGGANNFGAMTALDGAAVDRASDSIPMVMAGLKDANTPYLDVVNQSSGGAYDILNFHWYSGGDTITGGKNPESGRLLESIDEMRGWRADRAPGKPVWLSELGWDTFQQYNGRKSPIYAPEYNAANYLLRSIFLAQGRGVEKVFLFIYRDTTDNISYLDYIYKSSGLVEDAFGEVDGRKKPSWYYLATLKSVLGEYALEGAVSNGPNIYHYVYRIPGTDQRAAVMWARDGDRDSGYTVSYQQAPAGELIEPMDGSTAGNRLSSNGTITLSEKPVFVLYSGGAAPPPPPIPVRPGAELQDGRLTNGSFEDGLAGWSFKSWNDDYVRSMWSPVHGGKRAFRMSGSGSGVNIYQEIPSFPGERLTYSGWLNVTDWSSSMKASLELVPLNRWGGAIGSTPITMALVAQATGGWVEFHDTVTMPAGTDRMKIQVDAPTLSGTFYLDDLYIEGVATPTPSPSPTTIPPTPTNTPLATSTPTVTAVPGTPTTTPPSSQCTAPVNCSFEDGLTAWTVPDWFKSYVSIWPESHGGTQSASLYYNGLTHGPLFYQDYPASPGQRVDISVWANTVDFRSGMNVYVEVIPETIWKGQIGNPMRVATINQATGGWIQLRGSADMPANTGYVRVRILGETLAGRVLFDDFCMTLTPPPGASSTPTPTRSP